MKKIRDYLILQTNSICQHCDTKTNDLELHHIVPQQVELDNSLNNVILVCKECHEFIEKIASQGKPKLKTVTVDQSVHRLIKIISFDENISIPIVIANVIEDYYKKKYPNSK